jgi:hypothetical protein
MFLKNDWWTRQFIEHLKELEQAYHRFTVNREIEDFDVADKLHEELNEAYGVSLDLLDFVELGRALLDKQTLPHI